MNRINSVPKLVKGPVVIVGGEERDFSHVDVDSILITDKPIEPIVEKKILCTIPDLQALTSLKDLDLFMIIAESTKTLGITRNPILFLAYRLFKDGISEDEILREVNLLLIQLEDGNVDNILDDLEKRFSNKT